MASEKDSGLIPFEIPLNGRLRTADPGISVGADFTTLTNLRYTDTNPEAVGGQSAINTTAVASGNTIVNGIHFRKEQPAESHVLVQANGKVYKNDTAIPSAGDFTATQLWTDTSGADIGRFSGSPDGQVIYANSEDVATWGGAENRCAAFILVDPTSSNSTKYDYTHAINDTRTDAAHLATLTAYQQTINSAQVVLLMHMDNAATDSSGNSNTFTANNGLLYSTSVKRFGTHSALLDGSDDNFSRADDADFDFSGGTFTFDWWMQMTASLAAGTYPIFYHSTDANNYFKIYANHQGDDTTTIYLSIYSASSEVVALETAAFTATELTHIAVIESGDTYSIYINGVKNITKSDTDRAANYTGTMYIGTDTTNYYSGYIDEFRVSNIAQWTADFVPYTVAYGDNYASTVYIGSTKPLDGVVFDVQTANVNTSSATIEYWDGTQYTPVGSLVDGTSSGGITLAQDGTMSFDSTATTAKLTAFDRLILYWYKLDIIDSTGTPTGFGTLNNVTLSAPMQTLKDLWDGEHRQPITCMRFNGTVLNDFTVNIADESFDSQNSATFMNLGASGFGTSKYLLLGFAEPMMGLNINIIGDDPNTNASAMSVSYWNGTAYTQVDGLTDQTTQDGKSMNKSGYVTWTPIAEGSEFKRSDVGNLGKTTIKLKVGRISKVIVTRPAINNTGGYPFPLYVYKVNFSAQLSADVKVFNIGGIPAPADLQGFRFPMYHRNRVWLCDHTKGDKNRAICSNLYSSNVFNGDDSTDVFFGDETALTAAASLYTRYGDTVSYLGMFFKKNETWALFGNSPEDFNPVRISGVIGCVAPLSLAVAELEINNEKSSPVQVAIWQGANGVYMYSNTIPILISNDIRHLFDRRRSGSINTSKIDDSVGWYDPIYQEYHLLIATGQSSTLNEEWVFDLRRGKWYSTSRGSGKILQSAFPVKDTSGNDYTYGCDAAGFMYRLENGNTFGGNSIICTWATGDIALYEGRIDYTTILRRIKHIAKAKTTTTSNLSISHFGDSKTTATSGAFSGTYSMKNSGSNIVTHKEGCSAGPHVFHRFQCSFTTNDEAIGYEPVFFGGFFKLVREDL